MNKPKVVVRAVASVDGRVMSAPCAGEEWLRFAHKPDAVLLDSSALPGGATASRGHSLLSTAIPNRCIRTFYQMRSFIVRNTRDGSPLCTVRGTSDGLSRKGSIGIYWS